MTRRTAKVGTDGGSLELHAWGHEGRWRLPGALLVSALLQMGFVLVLPRFAPEELDLRPTLVSDRFVTVMLSKPPAAAPAPPKAAAAKPPPEPEPRAPKPEASPEKTEPRPRAPKPRKKAKRRAPRKRRRVRTKRTPSPGSGPPSASASPSPAPGPPAPSPAVPPPRGLESTALLGDAIVLDMDLSASTSSGGSGATGSPWGRGGAGPRGAGASGSGGDTGEGGALAAYQVDRLPSCPQLKPPYPKQAQRDLLEADVVLRLKVDSRGRVASARIKRRGGQGFDSAALSAARKLRCKPGLRRGEAVDVWIDYEIAFRMVASILPLRPMVRSQAA